MTKNKRAQGRPKVGRRRVAKNLSLDPVVAKAAAKMAFENGLSLSTWIEQLMRTEIRKMEAAHEG